MKAICLFPRLLRTHPFTVTVAPVALFNSSMTFVLPGVFIKK
jgi:hypothetical protein